MVCLNLVSLSSLHLSFSKPYRHPPPSPPLLLHLHPHPFSCCARRLPTSKTRRSWGLHRCPSVAPRSSPRLLCNAAEYVFPDPIPEFADAETSKFKAHLLEKLSKKDIFGDSLEEVVGVCTEQILSNFLHSEYGGPGTLMVVPFIDMADTINERGLPGGPQAARAAVVWAQNHIDKDWKD
ncbi:hypothetical protein AXF42_Ash002834 [Apostasia shenzhenica]|uniref:Protein plastid redox insensitive 2, chloroplastic n=1 Tax=Apostasia shenzhenica TaxID=1088818 RepID=A0A2I0A7E5_9ASPA|nr:hypothetical protein AXF42_Ash002834 [Apostasia shenzhenica]